MQAWTRLSDWILISAGFVAAFSPSMVKTTPASAGTLALLGGLLALCAVINLAAPKVLFVFWVAALLGLLLFLAPWGLEMTGNIGSSFVAWVVGAVSVVVGIGSAVRGRKRSREAAGPPRAA
ncbi:SPW repeat domain-containing protein [Arthrobacter pigmenti]